MSHPFRISVTDWTLANQIRDQVEIGHYFVFVKDGKLLRQSGRIGRLLGYKSASARTVLPLVDTPVELAGIQIAPPARTKIPMACLVADRDLYRVEQDTVHLFIAMPSPTPELRLEVTQNGSKLFDRPIELGDGGVTVEPLAMLLAGRYEAELFGADGSLGCKVSFTVAEYSLAPLSARLVSHHVQRAQNQLRFDLAVTSYGVAFDRELEITLIDGAREADRIRVSGNANGRFAGQLAMSGDGPFRLRAIATDDAARVCEVTIPGSRKAEREMTRISELGREMEMSLMPDLGAIPVRGAYITEGDHLATPLTVEEVITTRGKMRAHADLESLVLAVADLASGSFEIKQLGNVARGQDVDVELPSAMCTVFAGCFVDGHPFEGFTSFLRKPELAIAIDVPEDARPEEEIEIRVRTHGAPKQKLTCLVAIRDQRLTQIDKPEVALAAAAKRSIESLTRVLDDNVAFIPFEDALRGGGANAAPGGPARLVLVDPEGAIHAVELDTFIIGRSPTTDLQIASAKISRQHAAITRERGAFYVEDLGSANGVYVDGLKVMKQLLRDGQRITIGDSVLQCRVSGAPPEDMWEDRTPLEGGELDLLGAASFEDATVGSADQSRRIVERNRSFAPAPTGAPAPRAGGIRLSRAVPAAPSTLAAVEAADMPRLARREVLEENMQARRPSPPAKAAAAMPPARSAPRAPSLEISDDFEDEDVSYDMDQADDGAGEELGESPAPTPEVRATFPEVLYFGTVEIEGSATIPIALGGSLSTYTVEVFAFAGSDWAAGETTFTVDQPVRVDLDLPPAVHPEDRVTGALRAATASGQTRVRVTLDGAPVELTKPDGGRVAPGEILPSPIELNLAVRPGKYLAEVEDGASGETDHVEVEVGTPGKFKSYVRELGLLERGAAISLDSENAVALRVLPALDEPFSQLVDATAGYGHMCCEQTGAKILAATVMYLSAKNPRKKRLAEEIIVAGIAREQQMWRRGKGFAAYPEASGIAEYYTPTVVRYLWTLNRLELAPNISPALRAAIGLGLEMADDVARGNRIAKVPARIATIEDAYAVASAGPAGRRGEARAFVEELVDVATGALKVKAPATGVRAAIGRLVGGGASEANGNGNGAHVDPVTARQRLAYAAAALFAIGDVGAGVRVANQVTRRFNSAGRLYSTLDSAAAIALMSELEKTEVAKGGGRVKVNDRVMSTADAVKMTDPIESIEVAEGVAMVEVTRIHEEDWTSFANDVQVAIGFRDAAGKKVNRFRAGDRTELVVQLAKGYRMGDLVHVALPACMAWIHGGGRVKRFSIDFEGKNELRVPLIVTSRIEGRQHFAVCVRNMFEEARATSPGMLAAYAA